MSFVELVAPRPEHIALIASRMREWDRIEARAMGHTPAQALRLGMAASVDCYTVMIDGEPEGMIGMVPRNILEGEGAPWLLGSEAIPNNPRALMVLSRRLIAIWRDSLPKLGNLVAAENVRAIRYLRRLGFRLGDERVSIGGVDFVRFDYV
jgi:hypothetical protein